MINLANPGVGIVFRIYFLLISGHKKTCKTFKTSEKNRLLARTHIARFIQNSKSLSKTVQDLISGNEIQETGLVINYKPVDYFGKSKITISFHLNIHQH